MKEYVDKQQTHDSVCDIYIYIYIYMGAANLHPPKNPKGQVSKLHILVSYKFLL